MRSPDSLGSLTSRLTSKIYTIVWLQEGNENFRKEIIFDTSGRFHSQRLAGGR